MSLFNTNDVVINVEERRNLLPKELLSNNVVHLSCPSSVESGFCDVFVVGTFHISKESCREVRDVIRYLKPQVGFLELCSRRRFIIEQRGRSYSTKELVRQLLFYMLTCRLQYVYRVLCYMLTARMANKLEAIIGAECYVAAQEIKKYGGKVILGDRLIDITEERTWAKLPIWHKLKLMCNSVSGISSVPSAKDLNEDLEQGLRNDNEESAYEKKFPTRQETLLDERDQYMSCLLHKTAREHSLVVAVVGKAHLRGIKNYWMQPVDMDELVKRPPQNKGIYAAKIIVSVGIGAAIGWVVYIVFSISIASFNKAML